jgi:antitoxin YefM
LIHKNLIERKTVGFNSGIARLTKSAWTVSCPDMKSITYTAARENLASTINRVCEDNAPVVITRNRDQAVVMLSLAEYESLQETAHLLRSPANAKRLLKSIESLERGKGIRKKLKLDA